MDEPRRAGDPLDALRQEFTELRLLLDADLTVAAAALEDDQTRITRDVVTEDAAELAAFQARVLARLRELDAAPEPARSELVSFAPPGRRGRPWRRLPGAPLVAAAAAAVAVLAGVVFSPGTDPHRSVTVQVAPVDQATAYFQRFSQLAAGDADTAQLLAAADALHRSLQPLIAAAGRDPNSGAQAMHLLELEQQLLLRSQAGGLTGILAQTRQLIAELQAALPGGAAALTPAQRLAQAGNSLQVRPAPTSTSRASAERSGPASPAPQPAAASSPAPAAPPTASPSPSASPSPTPAPLPVAPISPFTGF